MLLKRSSKHEASNRTVLDNGIEVVSGKALVADSDPRLLSIYELYREAMGMSTPPDTVKFTENLTKSTAIIYPSEARVAGICLWRIMHKRTSKITALAVEGDRHRCGIGSEMMAAALRGMEAGGVRDVMVDALATPQAVSFYEKHGFIRLSYDAPGARPDVPMQRSLRGPGMQS